MSKPTYIYYHLFAVNTWKEVLTFQLDQITKTGLYAEIERMYIGVVYKDTNQLEQVKNLVQEFDKVELLFTRHFDELPVRIADYSLPAQLGEGETILHMAEQAKERASSNYLFLHSKGTSLPKDKSRSQIGHFYDKGLSRDSSDEMIRKYIVQELTYEVVDKWQHRLEDLKGNSFYHYLWNFFWVSSDLLCKFNFEHYRKTSPIAIRKGITDRHFTATFPISLYQALHGEETIKNRREVNIAR